MTPDRSNRRARRRRQAGRAFTLVELLVVMAVIGILAAALLVAGGMAIDTAKTRNTRAVLTIVRDAIELFKDEQRDNPTLTRGRPNETRGYRDRYGFYPPDELEVFSPAGVPYASPATGTLAVGGAVAVPAPPATGYEAMLFHDGLSRDDEAKEHRDLAAMIVAIKMFGDKSDVMLDGISSSFRSDVPVDAAGNPVQFLDREPFATPPTAGMEDQQIRYIVDAWGIPITYLAQIDCVTSGPSGPSATVSDNHPDWNRASTEMIRLNARRPILFSYGPDGPDQLDKEIVTAENSTATLIQDWADNQRIDDPLNDDNVYPAPSLKEKLSKGMPP